MCCRPLLAILLALIGLMLPAWLNAEPVTYNIGEPDEISDLALRAVAQAELDRPLKRRKSSRVIYPQALVDRGVDTQTLFRVLLNEKGEPMMLQCYFTTHPEGEAVMLEELTDFRWEPPIKDGVPVPAWLYHGLVGLDAGRRTAAPYLVQAKEPTEVVETSDHDYMGHAPEDLPRLYTVVRPKYPPELEPPHTLRLHLSVSSKGKVKTVAVIENTLPELDEAVLKAAKKWKFLPRKIGRSWSESEVEATVTYGYWNHVLVTDMRYVELPADAASAEPTPSTHDLEDPAQSDKPGRPAKGAQTSRRR